MVGEVKVGKVSFDHGMKTVEVVSKGPSWKRSIVVELYKLQDYQLRLSMMLHQFHIMVAVHQNNLEDMSTLVQKFERAKFEVKKL